MDSQGYSSVQPGDVTPEKIELKTNNNTVVEFNNYVEEIDDSNDNDSIFDGDDSVFECEEDENKDNTHNL